MTWLGGVEKFALVLPVLHLASSGTSEPISVPMESLSTGFSGFGLGLKSLTFTSNKHAHKNVEKRHQCVEETFACADLELLMHREAAFHIEKISNGNELGRQW